MKKTSITFNMPTKSDLKSRSSTINNAFVISITPYIKPNDSELEDYYNALEISPNQCGYCMRMGEGKTSDHIYPLVIGGLPSGYITDITNLIPCCKDCNSKKGGKLFSNWYLSEENKARLHGMGLTDDFIQHRYDIITDYLNKCSVKYDYKKIVGDEKWEKYCKLKDALNDMLVESQEYCNELNQLITDYINKENSGD